MWKNDAKPLKVFENIRFLSGFFSGTKKFTAETAEVAEKTKKAKGKT